MKKILLTAMLLMLFAVSCMSPTVGLADILNPCQQHEFYALIAVEGQPVLLLGEWDYALQRPAHEIGRVYDTQENLEQAIIQARAKRASSREAARVSVRAVGAQLYKLCEQ